ncbi:hypothetical protein [Gymnodinialimonas hymeniacidonis]|uniref:hypothetical protein n=1 Tax=Gymnodinialimonas hymeniacidonis TaxID=3126508 RepID=UPI0034C6B265
MKYLVFAAALATALPTASFAQDMMSVCYSRGSEAEGVSGFLHDLDGRALRIDSPNSSEERTRLTEWQDPGFAQEMLSQLIRYEGDMPADLLAQCDDGWRDTIVVRYDDGSSIVFEGSCARNPVAQTLDAIFATTASTVVNPTRSYIDGAAEGVYAPCFHNW